MKSNMMHIELGLSAMKPKELIDFSGSIVTMGPSSPLYTITVVSSGVGAVKTKRSAYQAACGDVADLTQKLNNARTACRTARDSLTTELTALAGAVLNNAHSPADVTGMAFTLLDPTKTPLTTMPAAPSLIDIILPKHAHGYATVSVHEIGGKKGRYVAQSATDPNGPWADLPGTGKSRRVNGAPGTKVLVRFAQVRGQLQSDWSTPTIVTIP